MDTPRRINVTSLAQYLRLRNCDRFLRLRAFPEEEKEFRRKWGVTIQPLTPLLQESGRLFEDKVTQRLVGYGQRIALGKEDGPSATREWLRRVKEPTILLQAQLEARTGLFLCSGIADVLHLYRDDTGALHIYVCDIKSSRQERTDHRLQIAAYSHLLREMCREEGVELASITGGVIHRTDNGDITDFDPTQPTFDLEPYLIVLDQLLLDPDSTINRIVAQPFDEVRYHLNYTCDGCAFNAICMYDSAERLDLALVPTISPVEKRALKAAGVDTVTKLAQLMVLPENGDRQMAAAPGKEELVSELGSQWPIGPRLPILAQKAQSVARQFDRSINARGYLFTTDWGNLPSEENAPGLIKIFFDAQYDYLADHIYLISALVAGPHGSHVIVEHTATVPTAEAERQLLLDWVMKVLAAVRQVADGPAAPVHLYCYNPYDQRTLLEALKRHLASVSLLPGFFDLATQHPAVSQSIISFLSTELETRQNLGLTCMPLHDAARSLGFDWSDAQHDYFQDFRARVFDNRRDVVRRWNGEIMPAPQEVPKGDPKRLRIESASRFNSQIPLEYAYAAWKKLPDSDDDRQLIASYKQVTWDHLRGFAGKRVEALAHIEGSFKFKNRSIEKAPLDLSMLAGGSGPQATLAQSLREFLFIEHYVSTQARLQTYSLPIERRMQTGLALFLRFDGQRLGPDVYRFVIPFDELGLDRALTMNNFRLKEGAWIVTNDAASPSASGSRVKNGRLGVIRAVGEAWLDVELLELSFPKTSRFRYFHTRTLQPVEGQYYTLDEMADDMNGDKALAALDHASTNVFYQWLEARPPAQVVTVETATTFQRAFDVISSVVAPTQLNSSQRETITGNLGEPLFLVQGPPGTGKSYTISWAAIARLLAAAWNGRPLRVAVTSKTHNAVNIVLKSIAAKWRRLQETGQAPFTGLLGLPVYKLVNDINDDVPDGVQHLHAYSTSPQDLERILAQPYVVVGGTPGGLYTLARKREAGGNGIDWSCKTFDLLIMDEASQMSLPEAVLAGAFLRADGQVVVVGDHRQMPPIIAHNWEEEQLRSVIAANPQLSLFESCIQRGFPRVSLDESFRLHETLADFLRENVYYQDGISLHSRNKALLPAVHIDDDYVRATLDPRYPIVVIEHGEQASQQYNELEFALLQPLLEASTHLLSLNNGDGLGVVVPHRAQRAMLQTCFPELAQSGSIDTVERFQGSERDMIIVSATASDPDYVLAEAEFLLNLNRLNVALSRPRKKLIVIASRSVTGLLTSDLVTFENAVIWKRLFYQYACDPLWQGEKGGYPISVRGRVAPLSLGT